MLGKAKIGLEYALHRSGPMSMAPLSSGLCQERSVKEARKHRVHAQPLSLEAFGQPLHTFPAFTASAAMLNPTSRARCTSRAAISRTRRQLPRITSVRKTIGKSLQIAFA